MIVVKDQKIGEYKIGRCSIPWMGIRLLGKKESDIWKKNKNRRKERKKKKREKERGIRSVYGGIIIG